MIDFRYHLVSLVSVFLALAVGIVLGAGPLKDSIGTKLTQEVQALRKEKDGLRLEIATANTALQHRDDYLGAVEPTMIGGQLADRSVAVVILPNAEDDVDSLVDAVGKAGGKVASRVTLNTAWTDPAKAEARAKVVTTVKAALPAGFTVPSTGEPDEQLRNLLADALLSAGASSVVQTSTASTTILDALRSADLIEVKGKVSGLASGAIMLAPTNAVDGTTVKAVVSDGALDTYVALATTLDSVGGGTVVTGPASSATDGGVLDAIRNDDDAKSKVSTVDNGSSPMGVISTVLALREQLSGASSGAYGFGSDVDDLMPAWVAAIPVTPSPSATK